MKMVPRLLSALLFVMFFLFGSVFIRSAIVRADTFAGGNGTQTYPYRVATCEQLQAMQDNTGTKYYVLTGDIDCSGTTSWNGGKGFTPLTFWGHLDGRNHTIQNLYINDPTTYNRGMFEMVNDSVVKNLKMTGASITGLDNIGGMFVDVAGSQISGVSFSGSVNGRANVGGLAAVVQTSTFSRCSFSGTVTGTGGNVGGLIDVMNSGTVSDCYSNADLVGVNGMGGLIYGSLAGPIVIERSYVAGSLLDSSSQGGFMGDVTTNNVSLSNNLVVASMPDLGYPGYYMAFENGAPIQSQNYFDMKQTNSVDCGSSGYNNAECIGVSGVDGGGAATFPFKNTTAVAPLTAWNFTTMWQVGTGYPTLRDAPLDPLASLTPTLSDTLTRIKANTLSDHQLDFSTVNGLQNDGDTFTVNFGPDWDLSALSVSDLDLLVNGVNVNLDLLPVSANTWGVFIDSSSGRIIFSAPASGNGYINPLDQVQLLIGTNAVYGDTGLHQITNPVAVSSYPVRITVHNTVSGNESYGYIIPIIDSDQVNVTSFINTFINFDLNVGTSLYPIGGPANDGTGIGSNIEMLTTCDPSGVQTCQIYAGSPTAASNYTVDLGNLAPGTLNASGVTVYHQDGTPGEINYIAFSLSSNAANGTTVAMASQNGALTRAGGAPDNWDIPSGSHGAGVPVVTAPINFTTLAGSAGKAYGFKFVGTPSYINIGSAATDPATTMQNVTGCKGTDATYCTLSTAPQTILTTGDTVEGLTATLGLGALANGTNPAGTYTDTLTFIATGTF